VWLDWFQNAFHDFATVHFFEGIVPFGDGPDAADDGFDIELPAAEQSDDALPDGPVVTEAALQGDVFLDQRIDVKTEWLRTPADFADPACGADNVECDFQCDASASGVDDTVATEAVALLSPGFGIADDDLAAVLFGDFQAVGVLRQSYDGDLSAAESGHGRAENADGAGTEDNNAVAGFDTGVFDHGVVGHAAGFGEAGLLEGELVRQMVKDAAGNANVLGHGTVDAIAEAFAGGVKVVEPAAGHGIVWADDGSGLGNDAVAFLPAFHIATQFDDFPSELVTENDGVVHWPGVVCGPLMKVGATYTYVGDFEEDILWADGGFIDFTDFDGALFGCKVNDGWRFHGCGWFAVMGFWGARSAITQRRARLGRGWPCRSFGGRLLGCRRRF